MGGGSCLFRDAWARAWPAYPRPPLPPHQLLSAASLFQLDALQRHCEILCSQTLSVESAVNTYKYAKVRARTLLHPGLAASGLWPGSLKGSGGLVTASAARGYCCPWGSTQLPARRIPVIFQLCSMGLCNQAKWLSL